MLNSGSRTTCVSCTSKRPKKHKLVWEQYVAACKKVGIDPDTRTRWTPELDKRRREKEEKKKAKEVKVATS